MAKSKSSDASSFLKTARREEIEILCKRAFGRIPTRVAFPGGRSRSAFMAEIGDEQFVLAKRDSAGDAAIEGIVMKALSPTGLVPRVVRVVDEWVVQELVDGIRLPVFLDGLQDIGERKAILDKSLSALADLQEFAHAENLHHRVPRVGPDRDWSDGNLMRPRKIAEIVDIAPPLLDYGRLESLFKLNPRDFVKADARPGNALVCDDRIVWFDWEGCGRRHALDDLAFVLSDEWTAIDPETEDRLIERHLARFSRSRSQVEAFDYLMAFGVFHMMARMHRAIRYRYRDGEWWSREKCLHNDKIGVTPTEVGLMCDRARRWSLRFAPLHTLAPWCENLMEKLDLALPDQGAASQRKAG